MCGTWVDIQCIFSRSPALGAELLDTYSEQAGEPPKTVLEGVCSCTQAHALPVEPPVQAPSRCFLPALPLSDGAKRASKGKGAGKGKAGKGKGEGRRAPHAKPEAAA